MSLTSACSSTAGNSGTKAAGLCEEEHILLHQIARKAVEQGLRQDEHLAVDTPHYPRSLREPGASFVTLKLHGELRGCIGSLEARRPLVEDIACNAYAAAFADPRFPPLTEQEFAEVDIQLSVLSPAEPMRFESEADLLRQLRPGIDGLILEDGQHRSTFLPAVWVSLHEPTAFLQHLKMKAGLPADHWSDTLKVLRYTTESF